MKIKDEGDIESFRDIIGDWVNEEMQGNDDSDFARRFRDSFISKRSVGNRLNSSNRFGNQFKWVFRCHVITICNGMWNYVLLRYSLNHVHVSSVVVTRDVAPRDLWRDPYALSFRLDIKSNDRKNDESNLLDETPERFSVIPLGEFILTHHKVKSLW